MKSTCFVLIPLGLEFIESEKLWRNRLGNVTALVSRSSSSAMKSTVHDAGIRDIGR